MINRLYEILFVVRMILKLISICCLLKYLTALHIACVHCGPQNHISLGYFIERPQGASSVAAAEVVETGTVSEVRPFSSGADH